MEREIFMQKLKRLDLDNNLISLVPNLFSELAQLYWLSRLQRNQIYFLLVCTVDLALFNSQWHPIYQQGFIFGIVFVVTPISEWKYNKISNI